MEHGERISGLEVPRCFFWSRRTFFRGNALAQEPTYPDSLDIDGAVDTVTRRLSLFSHFLLRGWTDFRVDLSRFGLRRDQFVCARDRLVTASPFCGRCLREGPRVPSLGLCASTAFLHV